MDTSSSRPAAVAGLFYPADPASLTAAVDRLLTVALGPGVSDPVARASDAPATVAPEFGRPWTGSAAADKPAPKAIIAPHAGYVYSGPTAAAAWAAVAPVADRIRRVVLLAPAHRKHVPTFAHPGVARMVSPAGSVEVDVAALERLGVDADIEAHREEHAIEVHLPFVSRVLPRARVVPLLVGGATAAQVAELLDRLWGGDETLIVVSSDLSHFLDYDSATRVDADTAARVVGLNPEPLSGEQACGCRAINGLVRVARSRGLRARLLDLCNSGDTAGGRDRVVGYGAFGFYEGRSESRHGPAH